MSRLALMLLLSPHVRMLSVAIRWQLQDVQRVLADRAHTRERGKGESPLERDVPAEPAPPEDPLRGRTFGRGDRISGHERTLGVAIEEQARNHARDQQEDFGGRTSGQDLVVELPLRRGLSHGRR